MICVAISSEDVKSAISKSKKAIQLGASLIEIRVDHFENPFNEDFTELTKNINSKLILTVRKQDEGGKFPFEENQRLELIQKCINAKPHAIDLEFSINEIKLTQIIQHAKKNHVKIILSFHDFQKTPEISLMQEKIVEASIKGANFIKIISTALSIEDNIKMLSLPAYAKTKNIQIVAFAMGRKGIISRILSPIFGAAFTFASFDEPTAPAQISIEEMKKSLRIFSAYSED